MSAANFLPDLFLGVTIDSLLTQMITVFAQVNFLEILILSARAGLVPGLLAGAIAMPLFSSTGLIYNFALGAGLGGIGATLYQGFLLSGSVEGMSNVFGMAPSLVGEFLTQVIYSGIIGIAIGGIVITLINETLQTCLGALYGSLLGLLVGLGAVLLAQNGVVMDPRISSLVIGAAVFALMAILRAGTSN